jgi:prefoldin subunit 5|tara:strand:- start:393 stop:599 length:207 start_codon:yes stop_codon:yes gene_type:complete
MTFNDILPIINVFGVIAGAVWSVAKISSAITLLNSSVGRLEDAVEKMNNKLDEHEHRLSHLEADTRGS